jgi:uncharacterized protein YqeY
MLAERLGQDLLAATKARDESRKTVLRWVIAQCKNLRIEKGEELTDDDVVAVIKRGVKMRHESVQLYEEGGRQDLADAEQREIEMLSAYLPEQLTGDALGAVVDAAIAATGASTMKDMGAVMKAVMQEHGSAVDGKEVQALVRERLSG